MHLTVTIHNEQADMAVSGGGTRAMDLPGLTLRPSSTCRAEENPPLLPPFHLSPTLTARMPSCRATARPSAASTPHHAEPSRTESR